MSSSTGHGRYRITGIRPWSTEGGDNAPQEIRTFFEGKDADMDDLRALTTSFGAEFESAVQGGGRHQAAILWNGHRYDLDLEPIT